MLDAFRDSKLCLSKDEISVTWGFEVANLETKDDLDYGTAVGENTKDAVFLLSASEALEFLKVGDKTASPTSYAIRQGAYTNLQ